MSENFSHYINNPSSKGNKGILCNLLVDPKENSPFLNLHRLTIGDRHISIVQVLVLCFHTPLSW